ncbi:MAG: hypothetical protein VB100_08855 [Angelakisella sp.]|nr:hypothetical protein [Angelakisella sp.]
MLDEIQALQSNLKGVFAVFSIIAAIYNAVICFFGYKLFKFQLGVVGFIVGGIMGGLLGALSGQAPVAVLCLLLLAIFGAWLAVKLYKLGVFLTVSTCTASILILVLLVADLFDSTTVVISAIVGIAAGVLGVVLDKAIIIAFTAISGGLMTGVSLLLPIDVDMLGFGVALGVIFAIIGVIVQFRLEKESVATPIKEEQLTVNLNKALTPRFKKALTEAAIVVPISIITAMVMRGAVETIVIATLIILYSLRHGWRMGIACGAACGLLIPFTFSSVNGSNLIFSLIIYTSFGAASLFSKIINNKFRVPIAVLCTSSLYVLINIIRLVSVGFWHFSFIGGYILEALVITITVTAIHYIMKQTGSDLLADTLINGKINLKFNIPNALEQIQSKQAVVMGVKNPPNSINSNQTVLVSNKGNFWCAGMPVIVTEVQISKQNQEDENVWLNIALQNVSDQSVVAIYFDVVCYDILQQKVGELKNISLLDLNIVKGQHWFTNKSIALPNKETRKCVLTIKNVVLSNEYIWNNEKNLTLQQIPQAQEHNLTKELAREYYTQITEKYNIRNGKALYKFIPDSMEANWYCSCGQLNCLSDKCVNCSFSKDNILGLYQPETLERDREARAINKLRIQEKRKQIILDDIAVIKEKGVQAKVWLTQRIK